MQEIQLQSLKDPWRRKQQSTPVFLAWKIPWTEEPGGLQSMGSQRVGHDWLTKHTRRKYTLPSYSLPWFLFWESLIWLVRLRRRSIQHFVMDCSSVSSVLRILQARILEWVAMNSSRGSSQPTDGTWVSWDSCITGGFFITEPWGKPTQNPVQFSSVTQSCPILCNPMNCSTPGLPVHHQLLKFTQTHVHRVGDAIQPSHPLLSPSPPAPNPSQHQGLFQ